MHKILKISLLSVFILLLCLIIIINFSGIEHKYSCKGEFTRNKISEPTTSYLIINEYRWWVHLWSDSDADMWLETRNKDLNYYSEIKSNNIAYLIYGDDTGHFSKISNKLNITVGTGFFDGDCIEN